MGSLLDAVASRKKDWLALKKDILMMGKSKLVVVGVVVWHREEGGRRDEREDAASNMAVGPTYCLFRAVNGCSLQVLKRIVLNWPEASTITTM